MSDTIKEYMTIFEEAKAESKKIGERIHDLRVLDNNSISQETLAFELSVTQKTISNYENNITPIDAIRLICLSKLFQVSVDFILFGKKSNSANSEKLAKMRNFVNEIINCGNEMIDCGNDVLNLGKELLRYIDSLEKNY